MKGASKLNEHDKAEHCGASERKERCERTFETSDGVSDGEGDGVTGLKMRLFCVETRSHLEGPL